MPKITVSTTIRTVYEVPDGVPIDRIRRLALPAISEADEQMNEVLYLHDEGVSRVFYGDQQCVRQTVENEITEHLSHPPLSRVAPEG